ncbi:tRNA (adenosine(37)-N6)-threonylcarbamoyltransferase complex dimerization subunit type 1 TsaB [Streptomyces capparidis]
MLLLAFDTATPAVTAAVHDGERVLGESTAVDARRHGELLLPAVTRALRAAGARLDQVTDIAVGVGPGPYTGLRVGLVTAAALGDALGTAVHGVCTLDGIAHAAAPGEPFAVATDARRKEVYWARYDADGTRLEGPWVDRPADLAERLAGLPVLGAGAALYPEAFPRAAGPEHVSAAALADLAAARIRAGADLLPPRPLYLRRPDARVPAGYKAVLPT